MRARSQRNEMKFGIDAGAWRCAELMCRRPLVVIVLDLACSSLLVSNCAYSSVLAVLFAVFDDVLKGGERFARVTWR